LTILYHIFEQFVCYTPHWEPSVDNNNIFLKCDDVTTYLTSSGYPHENNPLILVGSGYFRDAYLLQHHEHPHNNINNSYDHDLIFKISKLKHGCNLRDDTRFCNRNKFRHEQEELMLSQNLLINSQYIVHMMGRCGSTVISEYISTKLEDIVTLRKSSNNSHINIHNDDDFLYPLNEYRILEIAHDVAAGIEVLHLASIIHTDIQLDQFLVRENGIVALNDLNRARFIKYLPSWWNTFIKNKNHDHDDGDHFNHKEGCSFHIEKSVGKWRSPEEQLGSALTYKIDIYSMGLVFWSLLKRQLPFARLSSIQAKQAIVAGGRPPLSANTCTHPFMSEVCKIIRACWDSDPTKRPEARDVRLQLKILLESSNMPANKTRQ
jgi:serine/threonine protein kinase